MEQVVNNDGIEKVDLASLDVAEDKKQQLKQLFPSVFSEGKLDVDKLKLELGDIIETDRERFQFTWAGKSECLKVIQQPSIGTLKPCKEESVDFDKTENLFIEGDNLEVLKLLQKSYYGKVKMIYIDPPYNTGKEFIYPDNYSESLDTYLKYTGQVDNEGRKFSTNTDSEGRFHSKWLNMMYPRLYLAKNLLKDDGVIFISIDDNEVANLRKICDEIFGEENFVENIIWKKRYGGGAKEKFLVSLHEYILCYTKNIDLLSPLFIPQTKESIERYYTQKDENYEKMGAYRTHPLEATKSMGDRPNLVFPINAPDGSSIMPKRQWLWSKERVAEEIQHGAIAFLRDKNNNWSVHSKQYLKDDSGNIRQSKAFSIIDEVYSQHGTNEIIDLFGQAQTFSFPKPSKLLHPFLNLGTSSEEPDIILDFFSGSATTAHAVLDLNKQDNGTRKFILVQLPEPCDEASDAFKAGYKTIADIGKERIRRVIKKIKDEDKDKLLPDNNDLDLGFKVLKLDKSNFKLWDNQVVDVDGLKQKLDLFIEHIDATSTQEDILYELLMKSGFSPTSKIEQLELTGKKVFSIEEGLLLICLEDNITKELITAMAETNPTRVICLDSGFHNNDQLKTNVVQIMKSKDIEFRTV